jgi:hypothetical protein
MKDLSMGVLEPVFKKAGTALRNGPANGQRMVLTMKRLEIRQWPDIHLAFSRISWRSVHALEQHSGRHFADFRLKSCRMAKNT